MDHESSEQQGDAADQVAQDTSPDDSPEEFAEKIENDPAHNPDDEDLERLRGG